MAPTRMMRSIMASKRRSLAVARREQREQIALHAVAPVQTLKYETYSVIEKPLITATSHPLSTIVLRCRLLAKDSDFLNRFIPLKRAVYNYGFGVKPAETKGKKASTDDKEKLESWLDEPVTFTFNDIVDPTTNETFTPELLATNREMIAKFTDDCWDEWLLLDNVTAMWLDNQGYANTIPIERCQYTDVVGVPVLHFQHGLGPLDIIKLPPDQQERFKRFPQILINAKFGEHFKVLKRAAFGQGYGLPRLYSIFRLLGEIESKQIGMSQMAFMMREVTRFHKLGHEVKNGDRAGKPLHFWKKERSDAVVKTWKDSVGTHDRTANFDHVIEFPWPDLKVFDELAWKGSDARLMQWAGPLAAMMVARGVMPYLSPLLRAQATEDRLKMAEFLGMVINTAFEPPLPIKVKWSNTIFNESRLAAELVKFGAQQGWISATTGKDETGFDPVAEEDLKMQEAADPDAKTKFKPLWDAQHGIAPALGESIRPAGEAGKGAKPGSRPGAPPGTQQTT
jgi:hypothetical protein